MIPIYYLMAHIFFYIYIKKLIINKLKLKKKIFYILNFSIYSLSCPFFPIPPNLYRNLLLNEQTLQSLHSVFKSAINVLFLF